MGGLLLFCVHFHTACTFQRGGACGKMPLCLSDKSSKNLYTMLFSRIIAPGSSMQIIFNFISSQCGKTIDRTLQLLKDKRMAFLFTVKNNRTKNWPPKGFKISGYHFSSYLCSTKHLISNCYWCFWLMLITRYLVCQLLCLKINIWCCVICRISI